MLEFKNINTYSVIIADVRVNIDKTLKLTYMMLIKLYTVLQIIPAFLNNTDFYTIVKKLRTTNYH